MSREDLVGAVAATGLSSQLLEQRVTARQFLALINADLQMTLMLGGARPDEEVLSSATNAVRTFLRAFGKRQALERPRRNTTLLLRLME